MLEILSFPVFFLIICSFYAICCLGLNIQYGFTGLFNVGIAGFFGVGAYTSAILSGPRYPDTLIGGCHRLVFLPGSRIFHALDSGVDPQAPWNLGRKGAGCLKYFLFRCSS